MEKISIGYLGNPSVDEKKQNHSDTFSGAVALLYKQLLEGKNNEINSASKSNLELAINLASLVNHEAVKNFLIESSLETIRLIVVPLLNNTAGWVHKTVLPILESPEISIETAIALPVKHYFVYKSDILPENKHITDIMKEFEGMIEIHTHIQAWSQTKNRIADINSVRNSNGLSPITLIETNKTSDGVMAINSNLDRNKLVIGLGNIDMIGSSSKLSHSQEPVQDNPNNATHIALAKLASLEHDHPVYRIIEGLRNDLEQKSKEYHFIISNFPVGNEPSKLQKLIESLTNINVDLNFVKAETVETEVNSATFYLSGTVPTDKKVDFDTILNEFKTKTTLVANNNSVCYLLDTSLLKHDIETQNIENFELVDIDFKPSIIQTDSFNGENEQVKIEVFIPNVKGALNELLTRLKVLDVDLCYLKAELDGSAKQGRVEFVLNNHTLSTSVQSIIDIL